MANTVIKSYGFLRGRTAKELQKKMVDHQIKTGLPYKYQIYSDNEYHYAWYHGEIELQIKESDFKKKDFGAGEFSL